MVPSPCSGFSVRLPARRTRGRSLEPSGEIRVHEIFFRPRVAAVAIEAADQENLLLIQGPKMPRIWLAELAMRNAGVGFRT